MSETLLGIIIGGLIGIVPNIVIVFVEVWKQHRQQDHELNLKHLELVESQRMIALRDYAEQVGALISHRASSRYTEFTFLATQHRAMLYVSGRTHRAMIRAVPVIMAGWSADYPTRIPSSKKISSRRIRILYRCLRREMKRSFE